MLFVIKLIKLFIIILICICRNVSFAETYYKETSNNNIFFRTNKDIKVKLQITKDDIATLNKSVKLLKEKKISQSLSWAGSIKSENLKDTMIDYILWKKYTDWNIGKAEDEFNDLLLFIKTHQYLPNIKTITIKMENMFVNNKIPYKFAENYFNDIKPINTKTIVYILKQKLKDIDKINKTQFQNEVIDTFYEYNFTQAEMDDFLNNFSGYLISTHIIRKVEDLIWDNKYEEAKQLIQLLPQNEKTLYTGIIEIKKNPKYINNILRSIPNKLRDNELLLYTRLVYEHKDNKENALEILLDMDEETNYPEKWWVYQKYYLREFLKQKKYKKAYYLATNNSLKADTADYADSQWLAGWISLEFLDKPSQAYKHFKNMYDVVSYPVSKSRSAYWIGRSMEKDGNKIEAIKWYDIASKFTLYFYGQLSFHAKNELLQIPSLINYNPLPTPPSFTLQEEDNVLNNKIIQLAYLMTQIDENKSYYTSLFKKAINLANSDGERSAMFEIIKNTEDDTLILQIAKYLTYKNVFFIDNLFPILNIINVENPNSHLVHAIIKQESGFHISAKSSVGATGFMQLIPDTAKLVAKKMNLRYSSKALKTNPAYNILLGSYYINSLIKQFNGSHILAIASYNAGPNATTKWIKEFGDPRTMNSIKDIVNWLESITYAETRNYVQRVVENSIVYEYILDKTLPKYNITDNTENNTNNINKGENNDNKKKKK